MSDLVFSSNVTQKIQGGGSCGSITGGGFTTGASESARISAVSGSSSSITIGLATISLSPGVPSTMEVPPSTTVTVPVGVNATWAIFKNSP